MNAPTPASPHHTAASARSLNALFKPASIAVVGASHQPEKMGSVMHAALQGSLPAGTPLYRINPKAADATFCASFDEARARQGGPIDLGIFCIPAAATPAALLEAARSGVKAALICAGGFGEAGAEGQKIQDALRAIIAETGIRVLGPNTSGFFRPGHVAASFVPAVANLVPGNICVLAASGGMNHALSFLVSDAGAGIALGVGLGNAIDVDLNDVLNYAGADDTIGAIALHVESVRQGPPLLETLARVSHIKPVVALVVGRSDVARFAASHTGALATGWKTTRSLLEQAGAVMVDSENELVDAVRALSHARLAPNAHAGIGLVTAQAGPGLMILDHLLGSGVRVPELAEPTVAQLHTLLPPLTFQGNPVDTGRPGPTFGRVLAKTASDPAIDALAAYALAEPDAIDLIQAVQESGVPSKMPVMLGIGGPASLTAAQIRHAATQGIAAFDTPTRLARAACALVRDARLQWDAEGRTLLQHAETSAERLAGTPDEAAAKDVLDRLGIRTPGRRVCHSHTDAHAALDALQGPVAVKILDGSILHKTDMGGVHLGIRTKAELDQALAKLDAVGARAYLVERMAEPGIDLFIGLRRDPVFGPILVCGLGGTAAEVTRDVAIADGHATHRFLQSLLDGLQSAALLHGWRGGPTLDFDAFFEIASRLMSYFSAHTEIRDLEINPLRLAATGLLALDAVMVVTPN